MLFLLSLLNRLVFLGVVLFSSISCSYLDTQRRPKDSFLPGVLVETSLSDEELARRGAPVLYRFKSVPSLAMVSTLSSTNLDGIQLFKNSPDYTDVVARHEKSVFLNSMSAPTIAMDANNVDAGSPWFEGGFAYAHSLINSRLGSIAPVDVAIVDGGIVPATASIKNALINSVNLSTDEDACGWSDHGTGIASIFVGVQIETGFSPCSTGGNVVSRGILQQQGLAPNARIHSVRISFTGERVDSLRKDLGTLQLAAALDQSVALGAKVVNLSFSYELETPELEVRRAEKYVMAKAAERGVVFVAAVGNSGRYLEDSAFYPAEYRLDNLVVVGSHNSHLRRASDSSFGPVVDITGQGDRVRGNDRQGNISIFSGTSFSAPEVAAAIALYRGAFPLVNYRQVLTDLYSTTSSSYGTDEVTGNRLISRYGRLNAGKFIERGLQRSSVGFR